jgi:hypothetical protein
MGYLSIRNMPEHLEAKIVKAARRRHTTKTKVVIEALEQALAPAKKNGRSQRPSLGEFAENYPKDAAEELHSIVMGMKQIDSEMWK